MKNVCFAMAVLAALGLASGCASSRGGKVVSRDQARVVHTVEMGTIETVGEATIEGTKTPVGAVAGGVLGGVLGHAVGGGSGKDIATVAGALGGAAVGAVGEEKLTRKAAWELGVRLESGSIVSIVQEKEKDVVFAVGDRVQVLRAPDGTTRVRK
jgi:outer membrane lipoprotein SlyB